MNAEVLLRAVARVEELVSGSGIEVGADADFFLLEKGERQVANLAIPQTTALIWR